MRLQKVFVLILSAMVFSCDKNNKEEITPEELATWQTFDKGKSTVEDDMLIIEEIEGSDGYFLISPKQFETDFTLTYKVKALSESTVLITLFSVLQEGDNSNFSVPAVSATPQEVWDWRSGMKHYNVTINNRSHGITPFFFKNVPPRSRGFNERLQQNIMEIGQWYDVEIGKKENRLWFKLDGKLFFDVEDSDPYKKGRLIFRISGTTGEKVIFAKAAFKNIVISYK
ncbi:family 16 glycoside hydrolase [Ascidiimonas sp. W6]|uniref:family 16 glycoside hydrolase n=1 Tax=Ascidiimonas meishanensis TaxID=3128903 RepID=UPI0030EF351B